MPGRLQETERDHIENIINHGNSSSSSYPSIDLDF
jgi:hypothetical protein